MSESIEMYLLRIALLQENETPVPVPRLAQELSVSPVSANEMCRKLTEKALVIYEPYKGVRLTDDGDALAQRVLRHRRLWEVFFVEQLGIKPLEAEEVACRFEHVTPEPLAERLSTYLGHPTHSPQYQPIPASSYRPTDDTPAGQPLAALPAGVVARLVSANVERPTQEFLGHQGLLPGAEVTVLAVGAAGALLLEVAGQHVSLALPVAEAIRATPVPPAGDEPPPPNLKTFCLQETIHAHG